MIVNGLYTGSKGSKTQDLRRFTEQWADFSDAEAQILDKDDADFIGGSLFPKEWVSDYCAQPTINVAE